MPPELVTPAGQPVDAEKAEINRDFARAMATDKPEPAAPPKRPAPAAPAVVDKRGRGRPPKSDRARVAGAAAAASLTDEQRADGVRGWTQIGAGLCLIADRAKAKVDGQGKRLDAQSFKADAITIADSAEQLAEAVVKTAAADPKFAALVDRICAVGPYGALISTGIGIGTQIARNHRPAAAIPGTVDPADLIKAAEQEQAQPA